MGVSATPSKCCFGFLGGPIGNEKLTPGIYIKVGGKIDKGGLIKIKTPVKALQLGINPIIVPPKGILSATDFGLWGEKENKKINNKINVINFNLVKENKLYIKLF